MPRYAFKVQANFATDAARTTFGSAVQAFIDAHPTMFPFPPTNEDIAWHGGLTLRLVRGDLVARQDMDSIFAAMLQQLQQRGAVAPSTLWVKEQGDQGGILDSTSAAAPDPLGGADWTQHSPAIDS